MSVIQVETAIAAGAANNNIVSGSAYEFARTNQVVSIGLVQSVTGGFATIQAGPEVVAEEFSPAIKTTYPVIPDEMYYNAGMRMGDRLVIRYRNPTAGAITVRSIIQIQPVR